MRLLCLVYLYEHYMQILPYLQDPAKLVFVDLLFEYLFIHLFFTIEHSDPWRSIIDELCKGTEGSWS